MKTEDDRFVVIRWSDGQEQRVAFKTLRDACPCALCREERGNDEAEEQQANPLRVLSAAQAQPLRVVAMHPVGNYAYNIHFSDGHSSGIYTFEFLRELED